MNISIRKMRVFLSAAQLKSFTKASSAHNMSQPATTIIMNFIEEEVGCDLFERAGSIRRAVLTRAGQAVAETFSRIVSNYEAEMRIGLKQACGVSGNHRILVQSSFDAILNKVWLGDLLREFTDSNLNIETKPRQEILNAVGKREAIIGLVDGQISRKELDYAPLCKFGVTLAIPKGSNVIIKQKDGIEIADLPSRLVVSMSVGSQILKRVNNEMVRRSNEDNMAIVTESNTALTSFMAGEKMPALIPCNMTDLVQESVDCNFISLNENSATNSFGIVTPWGNLSRISPMIVRGGNCLVQ